MSRSAYVLERAWVDGAVRDDVHVEINDGRFTSVTLGDRNSHWSTDVSVDQPEFRLPAGETPLVFLTGLTLTGLA
ncbi:MAG: formimidoylglutamate deiminase, partial [Nocardioides sp.]